MIEQKGQVDQLPNDIRGAFSELKIGKHLRQAGICKSNGFSCFYLFQVAFLLIFRHKTWHKLLQSSKGELFPGKDAIYRFLNSPHYGWRKFLSSLSTERISAMKRLTSDKRVCCFIVDDSIFSRNRSKCVELLARVHDHAAGQFVRGFRMLTLGWSDGHSFLPIDFSLLSSQKVTNRIG
ncbi:hypothetical protein GJ688_13250, partial [Heliobacillus mobilis]